MRNAIAFAGNLCFNVWYNTSRDLIQVKCPESNCAIAIRLICDYVNFLFLSFDVKARTLLKLRDLAKMYHADSHPLLENGACKLVPLASN